MLSKEDAVRTAAAALKTAIDEAREAGYRVVWPANSNGLLLIAVSETAAVKPPTPAPLPAVGAAEIAEAVEQLAHEQVVVPDAPGPEVVHGEEHPAAA